jgi:hypothetical protein
MPVRFPPGCARLLTTPAVMASARTNTIGIVFAVRAEILLHLDDDVGVGEPHPVADGGAEHLGVDGALHYGDLEERLWLAGDAYQGAILKHETVAVVQRSCVRQNTALMGQMTGRKAQDDNRAD